MTLGEGALVGPYRLGRLLGRGGMAVVYEATHETIGRTVALKLVSPEVTDPGFLERFRHEGQMQAALDHPHVVPVYEAGVSEYGPYLAMRLVRGTTLAELIDDGVLTSSRTMAIMEQVADALDAAHAAGLIHRDIKPRNVLVEDGDNAFLADFGLTRRGDAEGATATGQFMGTIAYAAPEVVTGGDPGPAADRYALAAVLFECLTSTNVFPRPTQAAVLYAHTHEPPPRVSGRREGVPAALDEVLMAGLAKNPRSRPSHAADLITRARVALGGIELPPPAPRTFSGDDDETTAGQVTRPVPQAPARARPRWAPIAVAALVGLIAGGIAVALLDSDEPATVTAATATLPAPLANTEPIGNDLAADAPTVDCGGKPVRLGSPGCTVFRTEPVPRDGVIRRWGVRSATGELALTVIRPRGGEYFQVGRSRNEFVNDTNAHFFATELAVERGDVVGLVAIVGSGFGLRDQDGAETGRFLPALTGLSRKAGPALAGDLLLQVDYQPGGRQRQPPRLLGAEAARAPAGRTLSRERARFTTGEEVEIRVVIVDGRGAVDALRDGRRVARVFVRDLLDPLAEDPEVVLYSEPSVPEQIGVDVVFSRLGSNRIVRHFLSLLGNRFVLLA